MADEFVAEVDRQTLPDCGMAKYRQEAQHFFHYFTIPDVGNYISNESYRHLNVHVSRFFALANRYIAAAKAYEVKQGLEPKNLSPQDFVHELVSKQNSIDIENVYDAISRRDAISNPLRANYEQLKHMEKKAAGYQGSEALQKWIGIQKAYCEIIYNGINKECESKGLEPLEPLEDLSLNDDPRYANLAPQFEYDFLFDCGPVFLADQQFQDWYDKPKLENDIAAN